MTALAFLFTIGRFAVHWHRRRRLAWDDFFNGLAMLFCFAFTITFQLIAPTHYNAQLARIGVISATEVKAIDSSFYSKINAANSLIFWCVIYAVKASFLALYWHVFACLCIRFRVAWVVAAIFTFACFMVTFMWGFWLCADPMHFPSTRGMWTH
jgi:hypothetical protein